VQLRAGVSEWVKPASAMKPVVGLRMLHASARWIVYGTISHLIAQASCARAQTALSVL
jgi:hypothetical protein